MGWKRTALNVVFSRYYHILHYRIPILYFNYEDTHFSHLMIRIIEHSTNIISEKVKINTEYQQLRTGKNEVELQLKIKKL